MTDPTDQPSAGSSSGTVVVRYWAAARSAAGVESDTFALAGPTTLAAMLVRVRESHPDRPRLPSVLGVCSILVGDRPVGSQDPAGVIVRPGDTVELLPPFAGG